MKPTRRRREFLRSAGVTLAGAAGLSAATSLGQAAGAKAIKLIVWPESRPFMLDQTFGPGNAEGTDTHRWLLLVCFEITSHVDADGEAAETEDLISSQFVGKASVHAAVHQVASTEPDTPERWRELSAEGAETQPWAFQLRDRDSRPTIYLYESQPLARSTPIGFQWTVAHDADGKLGIRYENQVAEGRWKPQAGEAFDLRAEGFQLGAALDPFANTRTLESAAAVNVHAAAFAFWSPHPDTPEVELSYAGKAPNFSWPTRFQSSEATMSSVSGGTGIGYTTTTV